MRDLALGFHYAWTGFGLIRQPGIRRYVVLPLLFNVVLFAAAIATGAAGLDTFIDDLTQRWSWAGWFTWILWPLFVILACVVFFSCFSLLVNLVVSPFNAFLAAAVERHLGGPGESPTQAGLLHELAAAFRGELQKLLYFLLRALPLLLLFVIPIVNAVAPVVWFAFGAWMLSLEYLDFPLGNHGMLFPQVRARARQRRALVFGFGCGVLLVTLVPVLNFVAVPVAVAGAARLSFEQLRTPA